MDAENVGQQQEKIGGGSMWEIFLMSVVPALSVLLNQLAIPWVFQVYRTRDGCLRKMCESCSFFKFQNSSLGNMCLACISLPIS